MGEMRCETCRWWDSAIQLSDAEPDTTGACRVRPPVADDRSSKARWPFTEDVDWCASHTPRDNDESEARNG